MLTHRSRLPKPPLRFLLAAGLTLITAWPAGAQMHREWEQRFSSPTVVYGRAADIVLDASGNAYAAGSLHTGQPDGTVLSNVMLVKFTPAGVRDNSFGGFGAAIIFDTKSSTGIAAAVDANGKILVLSQNQVSGSSFRLTLMRFTASGALDPEFGDGGKVHIPNVEQASDIALDSAGNIYLAGTHATQIDNELIVVKLTPSGALDTSFGGTGVRGLLAYAFESGVAIAVNSSGALFALSNDAFTGNYRLRKILPDGRLDTSFSTDGKLSGPDVGVDLVVDSSGRVLVLDQSDLIRYTTAGAVDGTFTQPGFGGSALALDAGGKIHLTGGNMVARFGANGGVSPDTTFNSPNGFVSYAGDAFQPGNADLTGIAVDAGGNVFVAGGQIPYAPLPSFWTALKYTSAGTDAAKTVLLGTVGAAKSCAVASDPSGNAFVGGQLYNGSRWVLFVSKFTPDGNSGISFGGKGIVTHDGGAGINESCRDLAVHSDGSVYFAGEKNTGQTFLLKYTPAGALDTSFNATGLLNLGTPGSIDIEDVALDVSGNLFFTGGVGPDLIIGKVTPAGALDAGFGAAGLVNFNNGATERGKGITVEPGTGKIYVTGYSVPFLGVDAITLSYKADGTLNKDFNGTGYVYFDSGGDDSGAAVRLDASGRVYVAGTFQPAAVDRTLVIRYSPIGTYDTSFRTQGFTISPDTVAVKDLALDRTGQIYVLGGLGDKLFVSKYTSAGKLTGFYDQLFGDGGVITADSFFPGDAPARFSLLPAEDSLYISGTFAYAQAWTIKTAVDQLKGGPPQGVDDAVKIFPMPFMPAKGHTTMFFSVPPYARIKIFTVAGELVKDFEAGPGGVARWDARNNGGQKVASDVYFVLIEAAGAKRLKRLVVQR